MENVRIEEAVTIRNVVKVAIEEFESFKEQDKFIAFMLSRFGNSYQTITYCAEWANRIKKRKTGVMDGITIKVYNRIYGGDE